MSDLEVVVFKLTRPLAFSNANVVQTAGVSSYREMKSTMLQRSQPTIRHNEGSVAEASQRFDHYLVEAVGFISQKPDNIARQRQSARNPMISTAVGLGDGNRHTHHELPDRIGRGCGRADRYGEPCRYRDNNRWRICSSSSARCWARLPSAEWATAPGCFDGLITCFIMRGGSYRCLLSGSLLEISPRFCFSPSAVRKP